MPDELETWKNPTEGRVWINRLDRFGELVKVEVINSGKTFHISPGERRLNQEMAATSDQDVFSNGTLSPMRLLEGDADAAAFAANPNLMTEDDMRVLFKPARTEAAKVVAGDAFIDRLASIKNIATLDRLLALAREEDAPLSRVEAITQRMAELQQPNVYAEAVATSSTGDTRPTKRSSSSRAVTPG